MSAVFNSYKVLHLLPKPGEKVRYVNPSRFAWFTSVLEDERNLLEVGKEYTVSKTELNSDSIYIWLEEFPKVDGSGPFFNMCAFDWNRKLDSGDEIVGFKYDEVKNSDIAIYYNLFPYKNDMPFDVERLKNYKGRRPALFFDMDDNNLIIDSFIR